MFPDSNRRQTSLEKLKPKRHSAKALRLLPSILRGNKSIFHMTLSARGVLWLFLTIAVPAGAVHLTCTVFQQRWQMAFSQRRRLPRRFRVENPACSKQLLCPLLCWHFWGGPIAPGGTMVAAAMCSVAYVAPRSTTEGSVTYPSLCWQFQACQPAAPTGTDAGKGGQPSPNPSPSLCPTEASPTTS